MTNKDLAKKWRASFPFHFLYTRGGKTVLCGTYTKPIAGSVFWAYIPLINDFDCIAPTDIVAIIHLKQLKSTL